MLIIPTVNNHSPHFRGSFGSKGSINKNHHSFISVEENFGKNFGVSDDFDSRISFRTACFMEDTRTMGATYIHC